MSLESGNSSADIPLSDPWHTILLKYGATAERVPVVREILMRNGITPEDLPELIHLSESLMGLNHPFTGFSGSDAEIDQIAADLQAEKTMVKAHFEDHD